MIIEDKGLFSPKMANEKILKMRLFKFLAPEKARNSKFHFLSIATKIQIKYKTELFACKACQLGLNWSETTFWKFSKKIAGIGDVTKKSIFQYFT